MQLFKENYKNISITSISDLASDGELLDLYLRSVQENSVYKEPCFERKMKDQTKLSFEHLF